MPVSATGSAGRHGEVSSDLKRCVAGLGGPQVTRMFRRLWCRILEAGASGAAVAELSEACMVYAYRHRSGASLVLPSTSYGQDGRPPITSTLLPRDGSAALRRPVDREAPYSGLRLASYSDVMR